MPADVKVKAKVAPLDSVPESHTPVSLVVVWGVVAAVFVHVTVSPTLTDNGVGWKAKLTIDT